MKRDEKRNEPISGFKAKEVNLKRSSERERERERESERERSAEH